MQSVNSSLANSFWIYSSTVDKHSNVEEYIQKLLANEELTDCILANYDKLKKLMGSEFCEVTIIFSHLKTLIKLQPHGQSYGLINGLKI